MTQDPSDRMKKDSQDVFGQYFSSWASQGLHTNEMGYSSRGELWNGRGIE
jgi:hypothetical protein